MAQKAYEEPDDEITAAIKGALPKPAVEEAMAASPLAVDGPTNTGINPNAGSTPALGPAEVSAKPDFRKLGQFANKEGPWGAGNEKFNRSWDEMSPRYKMLTVLSHFDPTKGLTQEAIDALNANDINGAKFALGDSPDKLDATNLQGWEGFDGHQGLGDVIEAFKSGKGKWAPWSPLSKVAAEGASGGGGEPLGQSAQPIPFESGGVPTDDGFFQKMLAALRQQAGSASTDRNALMAQMGTK